LIEEAKKGNVEIWTSNFTLAKVFKRPCDGQEKGLQTADDQSFEDFIIQPFVTRVQVDLDVGTLARRLLRTYPVIGKPQDGIHVATALLNNLDELHTFDRDNLLGLTNTIPRKDGFMLRICHPPKPPAPAAAAVPPLLQAIEEAKREDEQGNQAAGSGTAS
jgi:hypothetical protein